MNRNSDREHTSSVASIATGPDCGAPDGSTVSASAAVSALAQSDGPVGRVGREEQPLDQNGSAPTARASAGAVAPIPGLHQPAHSNDGSLQDYVASGQSVCPSDSERAVYASPPDDRTIDDDGRFRANDDGRGYAAGRRFSIQSDNSASYDNLAPAGELDVSGDQKRRTSFDFQHLDFQSTALQEDFVPAVDAQRPERLRGRRYSKPACGERRYGRIRSRGPLGWQSRGHLGRAGMGSNPESYGCRECQQRDWYLTPPSAQKRPPTDFSTNELRTHMSCLHGRLR